VTALGTDDVSVGAARLGGGHRRGPLAALVDYYTDDPDFSSPLPYTEDAQAAAELHHHVTGI
jgi:hypothetical protein